MLGVPSSCNEILPLPYTFGFRGIAMDNGKIRAQTAVFLNQWIDQLLSKFD